jgi:cytoskeletal protein CcmA (bactofilin family)
MSSNGEYATTIGPDAVFKGDLEFESGAKVLGRIEGTVASTGKILIADGSECTAAVTARDVSVEGVLTGNVEAGDRISVAQTGQVHGDIQAARMTMAEGATVNGYCRIGVAAGGAKAGGAGGQAAASGDRRTSGDGKASGNGQAKREAEQEAKPAAKATAAGKR